MSFNYMRGLLRRHEKSEPLPFVGTSGFDFTIDGETVTVPYRVKFSEAYIASDDVGHFCRRSRSSDGHKREAALKELVSRDLDTKATAYVLVALGDYVLQVSSLPLQATSETKERLSELARQNPRIITYLEAVTVSYWNEYYRGQYTVYADYPPYKFLQILKAG